jgi:hypothetical protein
MTEYTKIGTERVGEGTAKGLAAVWLFISIIAAGCFLFYGIASGLVYLWDHVGPWSVGAVAGVAWAAITTWAVKELS